jgi:hypothetical protein
MKITEFPEGFDIDALREKWLAVGRTTARADRPKMEAAVRHLYEFCGFKQPQEFIWSDSPLSAALAKLKCEGKKPDAKKSVWDILGGYSWYTTGAMGSTSLWAYYDAGRQVGVQYTEKENAALDACLTLTGTGFWFPFENVVFMCDNPTELHLDAQGSLHNEDGPAMLFGDGYSLYSYHGVRVPRDVIEYPEQITAQAALKEENAEIRRVMCERMGWERFVKDAKLKLVHECPDPGNPSKTIYLYDTPSLVEGTKVRLFLCTNGTPKPNGEIPQYGLTVPVELSRADEAGAWIANMPVEMYRQIERRT